MQVINRLLEYGLSTDLFQSEAARQIYRELLVAHQQGSEPPLRDERVLDPGGYEIGFYQTVGEPKPPAGVKIV